MTAISSDHLGSFSGLMVKIAKMGRRSAYRFDSHENADAVHHSHLLILGQTREHRQRDDFRSDAFGHGQAARTIAPGRVAF